MAAIPSTIQRITAPDRGRATLPAMGQSMSRASIGRVIEDLGSTLVEQLVGTGNELRPVSEVVIHDPFDELTLRPDALVLGVGVRGDDDTAELLRALGAHGASALVIKSLRTPSAQVAQAATESNVTLLGLSQGVSWNQIAAMLRALIAEGTLKGLESSSAEGAQRDLFALANALTALLDAPLTIEDRSSRVIAFSGRQDEADAARVQSILDRQVPTRFTKRYEDDGVFRALYRSEGPVFIPADPNDPEDTALSRVAMVVRAGEEILGSIWVAVKENLDEDRSRALEDAAKLVALEMMKMRAGAHVERRLRTDLVSAAVTGGTEAAEACERLGITGHPAVVLALALEPREAATGPDAAAELLAVRERVGEALSLHLSAVSSRSVAAVVGDYCFGIITLPGNGPDADDYALGVVSKFLERVSSPHRLVAGIGAIAPGVAGLDRSRSEAERAVRVLRARKEPRAVARLRDVQAEALVLELADTVAARDEKASGPVARLADYDAKHDARLVETLAAWLDNFGDVGQAAKSVFAHPNSFRYRLKRVAEVGGLDLADKDQRFAAMLHLRLWAGSSTGSEPTEPS